MVNLKQDSSDDEGYKWEFKFEEDQNSFEYNLIQKKAETKMNHPNQKHFSEIKCKMEMLIQSIYCNDIDNPILIDGYSADNSMLYSFKSSLEKEAFEFPANEGAFYCRYSNYSKDFEQYIQQLYGDYPEFISLQLIILAIRYASTAQNCIYILRSKICFEEFTKEMLKDPKLVCHSLSFFGQELQMSLKQSQTKQTVIKNKNLFLQTFCYRTLLILQNFVENSFGRRVQTCSQFQQLKQCQDQKNNSMKFQFQNASEAFIDLEQDQNHQNNENKDGISMKILDDCRSQQSMQLIIENRNKSKKQFVQEYVSVKKQAMKEEATLLSPTKNTIVYQSANTIPSRHDIHLKMACFAANQQNIEEHPAQKQQLT